jgi:hypothetical protein
MKLVKIEDVRVGQIWTFNNGKTYDIVISVKNVSDNLEKGLNEVNYEIWGDFNYMVGEKETADSRPPANKILDISMPIGYFFL